MFKEHVSWSQNQEWRKTTILGQSNVRLLNANTGFI